MAEMIRLTQPVCKFENILTFNPQQVNMRAASNGEMVFPVHLSLHIDHSIHYYDGANNRDHFTTSHK